MPFHIYQFPFFKSNFLELPKTLTRSSNCKNIAIHQKHNIFFCQN